MLSLLTMIFGNSLLADILWSKMWLVTWLNAMWVQLLFPGRSIYELAHHSLWSLSLLQPLWKPALMWRCQQFEETGLHSHHRKVGRSGQLPKPLDSLLILRRLLCLFVSRFSVLYIYIFPLFLVWNSFHDFLFVFPVYAWLH